MPAPSSRHLSHDFPAYKGLTLRELASLSLAATTSCLLVFTGIGLLLNCPVALGCTGFLTGFIASVTLVPKPVARLKEGKPPNHLMKLVYRRLARARLVKSPYLGHTGSWQKTRRVRSRHV